MGCPELPAAKERLISRVGKTRAICDCDRGESLMARAFILVLDSVGIGSAPDAELYGDAGADTVCHIAEACARGEANRDGLRSGPLHLPNLVRLGLGIACQIA